MQKLIRLVGTMIFALMLATTAQATNPTVLATITGIPSAENAIQASDGRIFVSSKGNLFQIKLNGNTWSKTAINAVFQNGISHACTYSGLTEYNRAIYTLCSDNELNIFAPKHLMVLDLNAAIPNLMEVGALNSVGVPNGLASDGQGHLYYTNFGILYPGNLHRITLDGRLAMTSDQEVLQFVTENPNGIKIKNNQLYLVTDSVAAVGITRLLRYPLTSSGIGSLTTAITSSFSFFDDFSLINNGGILMADFLLSQIKNINESTGQTTQSFNILTPTSATVINVSGTSYLLVTQRTKNQVSILSNPWNITPR